MNGKAEASSRQEWPSEGRRGAPSNQGSTRAAGTGKRGFSLLREERLDCLPLSQQKENSPSAAAAAAGALAVGDPASARALAVTPAEWEWGGAGVREGRKERGERRRPFSLRFCAASSPNQTTQKNGLYAPVRDATTPAASFSASAMPAPVAAGRVGVCVGVGWAGGGSVW